LTPLQHSHHTRPSFSQATHKLSGGTVTCALAVIIVVNSFTLTRYQCTDLGYSFVTDFGYRLICESLFFATFWLREWKSAYMQASLPDDRETPGRKYSRFDSRPNCKIPSDISSVVMASQTNTETAMFCYLRVSSAQRCLRPKTAQF